MFSRRPDSLRLQLLRWLLAPLLLLLLVNSWFSERASVATSNIAFDRLLAASAEAIAEDVDVRDGEIIVDLPYAALQLLESNLQERIFYRVLGPDGKTVTGYDDLPLPKSLARLSEEPSMYSARYRGDTVHLAAISKQTYGPHLSAAVTIVVAETGEARYAFSHQILVDEMTRQAVLIAAAGLLVWFGLVRGLRPLGRLTRNLADREPSDLGPIDPTVVQTEVWPLIAALNRHTARIQRLLESQSRLVTDASHQMRTPLTVMRTQIDYSLRSDDVTLMRQTLHDVQADIDRLAHLIGQWMLLARADAAVAENQPLEKVDVGTLAHAVAHEFVPAARARTIDLALEVNAGLTTVDGNELLIRELIANLVDNAIRHGKPHGSVSIRVDAGPEVMVEVVDDGPGIAPDERGKVFERFYRGRAVEGHGSGLGLAIVREICLAHGALIELGEPAAGQGLRVRVRFRAVASA